MNNEEPLMKEMERLFMRHLRLYHYPVGIFFEKDGNKRAHYEFYPKNKISFCQLLAFSREVGKSAFLPPDKISCVTANDLFGLSVSKQRAVRSLRHYLQSDQAEEFYHKRPRIKQGPLDGVGASPLSQCDSPPDAVIFVVDNLQAMHLMDYYLKGSGGYEVQLTHHVNGAACGNTIKAIELNMPQMALPCPGAFSSGKLERGELIISFPYDALTQCFNAFKTQLERHGISLLRGKSLVGMDVCRNCPLIRFERIKS